VLVPKKSAGNPFAPPDAAIKTAFEDVLPMPSDSGVTGIGRKKRNRKRCQRRPWHKK
jgi:hypothetical protein